MMPLGSAAVLASTTLPSTGTSWSAPSRVLSFLSDNRTLLAAGADRTVRLVDVNVQAALDVHAGGASGLAYHSNGRQVLTAGADKTVKLWSLDTGKLDRTFGPVTEAVTAVAFSRATAYCMGVNCWRHSASVFLILSFMEYLVSHCECGV